MPITELPLARPDYKFSIEGWAEPEEVVELPAVKPMEAQSAQHMRRRMPRRYHLLPFIIGQEAIGASMTEGTVRWIKIPHGERHWRWIKEQVACVGATAIDAAAKHSGQMISAEQQSPYKQAAHEALDRQTPPPDAESLEAARLAIAALSNQALYEY